MRSYKIVISKRLCPVAMKLKIMHFKKQESASASAEVGSVETRSILRNVLHSVEV